MARTRYISIATVAVGLLLFVGGCTTTEATPISASSQTTADETLSFQDQLTVSYNKFTTEGGSEYVYSGGDNYVLTLEPNGDSFTAALYNESFDDVIGIDEPMMVTLISAKTMLDDPATTITETSDGLELRNEQYGAIGLHFENGLVVSYEALEDTWHGTITYEVDKEVMDMLNARLAEEQG
jgi:hypothetical protein